MGCNFALIDRTLLGTLELWKVRNKMPFRMHEVRRFNLIRNGCAYLFILDISRFGSSVDTCRYEGESVRFENRLKVKDLYLEDGALVASTRKGPLRMTCRTAGTS